MKVRKFKSKPKVTLTTEDYVVTVTPEESFSSISCKVKIHTKRKNPKPVSAWYKFADVIDDEGVFPNDNDFLEKVAKEHLFQLSMAAIAKEELAKDIHADN